MNVWQLAGQLVFCLRPDKLTWPDSPGEPVLSRALVGPASPDVFNHDAPAPFAIVHPEGVKSSLEHPADLVEEARFTIYLFGSNASEQAGGAAIMGGNRASLGSSRGRGLLEVEALVKAQIFNQLGLLARGRSNAALPPSVAGKMAGVIAERALEVVVTNLPSYPLYPPIRRLKNLNAARVTCSFDFSPVPSSRWDLAGFAYNSSAGATAPTDPTAATFVQADGSKSVVFTILGTAMTNWGWELHTNLGTHSGTFTGASTTAIATNLAATISALGGGARFTATASGSVVTVIPKVGGTVYALVGMSLITPGESGTANQVSVKNSSGIAFLSAFGTGQRSFSFWWAYDATKDPFLGYGVAPVAANRWSSYRTAQDGLVYVPASATITVT